MTPTIYITMGIIMLHGLLFAYNTINTATAYQTMKAVAPGTIRTHKRKTYTEKELAQLDYLNYRTMFTISLIALIANAITSGLLLYVFITIYK